MKIYTRCYNPFIMGGNVHGHVATEVDTTAPVDVGHGMQCVVVTAPNGQTFVAETGTGALVGDSIDTVKADMAADDFNLDLLRQQITQGAKDAAGAQSVETEEFWRLLKCAQPTSPLLGADATTGGV